MPRCASVGRPRVMDRAGQTMDARGSHRPPLLICDGRRNSSSAQNRRLGGHGGFCRDPESLLTLLSPVPEVFEWNTTMKRLLHLPCLLLLLVVSVTPAGAEDWPQFRGPNGDNSWNGTGILETFPADGLKIRWRMPVGGGFSSPVVAKGRVYVIDSTWETPKAIECIHCFEETTGNVLWRHRYDGSYPDWAFEEQNRLGPVSTPIVRDGKIYALGWSGHLFCLDAETGGVIWHKELGKEYPRRQSACNASPLIEGDLLVVCIGANPGTYLAAFNKDSGKEVWMALDEPATHSSPVIITAGGVRQLILWTQGSVTSLDPASGKVYWREKITTGADYAVATPVCRGDRLLVSGIMFKLEKNKPSASVLWPEKATRRVLSNTSTPLLLGDHLYSAKSQGELVCMDAATGQEVWLTKTVTDLKGGASIQLTPTGDSVFLFTDKGDLIRARLTPQGYEERTRAHLIDPTFPYGGRKVTWAAPAFANRHIFARNGKELVCASLASESSAP